MIINASTPILRAICAAVAILAVPSQVLAYIVPGAGLSIVGSLIALFVAIFVAIFGFLWFPIRRMLRKKRRAPKQAENPESIAGTIEASKAHKAEHAENEV